MPPEDDKNKDQDKNKDDNKADHVKEIETLKAQNADILAKLEKLTGKDKDDKSKDEDLTDKVRKEKEARDLKNKDSKAIESALRFSINSEAFLKNNASLLPKEVTSIFEMANKETYDSEIQKASAIKSGIIQEFFKVQANLDLLTPGLKSTLEDYLKLTKDGKQERAQEIFDSIFEPSLEMIRRVKKAEALQKGNHSGSDDAFIEKRVSRANKHFLREKSQ